MIRVSDMDITQFPAGETTLNTRPTDTTVLLDDPSPAGVNTALQYAYRAGGIHLIAAYFSSARADKPGRDDATLTARLLASSGVIRHITVLDPHSQVTVDALQKFFPDRHTAIPAYRLLESIPESSLESYTCIVAPDQGAVNRASGVAKKLGLPMVSAVKKRNQETGRIISYQFDTDEDLSSVLVVDDICDGGATFALLRDNLPGKADLMVSHGVFSGKAEERLATFDAVYTTDSLRSSERDWVSRMKVGDLL